MKKLLFFIALLLVYASSSGKPVAVSEARKVAKNFWSQMSDKQTELNEVNMAHGLTCFYLFEASDWKGFIVVPNDDRVLPVLAYSLDNGFDAERMPISVQEWFEDYEAEIRYLVENDIEATPFVAEQWERLLSGNLDRNQYDAAVSPMITTTWNQSPYYNNRCPYDNNYAEKTVTGCVATATAQVMKYWGHPSTGRGSHSYSSNYGVLSANFGATTYNWSAMPTSLNSYSSSSQINAVATLMYHVGVAMEMDYGVSATGGSGAFTTSRGDVNYPSAENALVNYFKYSSSLYGVSKENFTDSQWKTMLKTELNASRPIIYSGRDESGGHCFVCDGFNNSDQFHFNWGWGGYCDGYYAVGALNPSPGGTGGNATYTFNISNQAILGIRPNNSSSSVFNITTTAYYGGSVSGAGSYAMYDTVSLLATANSGYKFTGWSDGCVYNPREFLATGNMSFAANFAPIAGDTISYSNNARESSFNPDYFGMKIPSSSLASNRQLSQVQLYDVYPGNYMVYIYEGGTTAPQTLLHSQSFYLQGSNSWFTLNLSSPIEVDASKNLWVTFYSADVSYPGPMTSYCGNDDGGWYSNNGTNWYKLHANGWNYTYMIRAIFTGNSECGTVTSLPYTQDFSNLMSCWSYYVPNSDNNFGLMLVDNDTVFSFSSYYSSSDYNQYLISPRLELNRDILLKFDCKTVYPYTEEIKVLYSTTNKNVSSFVNQAALVQHSDMSWETYSVLIPAEAKYIAFDYCSDFMYYLYIDDIQFVVPPTKQISFTCSGNGSGQVTKNVNTDNLCGSYDAAFQGFHASYRMIPQQGNKLSHLYIGGVDYLNPNASSRSTNISLSTGISFSSLSFNEVDNDYEVQAVFDTLAHYSVTIENQGDGYLWFNEDEYVSGTAHFTIYEGNDDFLVMGKFKSTGSYSNFADYYGCLQHLFINGVDVDLYNNPDITIYDIADGDVYLFSLLFSNINQDLSIVAQFGDCSHLVQVISNDTSLGTVMGGGNYEDGAVCSAMAIPRVGSTFMGWNNSLSDNPYNFRVTEDVTLIANFVVGSQDTVPFMDTILVPVFDTTFVSIFDTTIVPVFDTTFVPIFDTTFVVDTNYIQIFDTTLVMVFDTTFVPLFDTVRVTLYDTNYVQIVDTNWVIRYDTTYIHIYDTMIVPVFDTTFVSIFDTTIVPVFDTTFVPIFDTTFVVDTNYIQIFDTTLVMVFDTTFVPLFDTIRVTLYDTNYVQIIDTNWVIRYDTTYIHIYDTTRLTIYDTLRIFDTIMVPLFDTIVHYDTIIVDETTYVNLSVMSADVSKGFVAGNGRFPQNCAVEIAAIPLSGYRFSHWDDGSTDNPRIVTLQNSDAFYVGYFDGDDVSIGSTELSDYSIATEGTFITILNAENKMVRIFDTMGRQLFVEKNISNRKTYQMPVSGAYYVQVGDSPARKVVVVR